MHAAGRRHPTRLLPTALLAVLLATGLAGAAMAVAAHRWRIPDIAAGIAARAACAGRYIAGRPLSAIIADDLRPAHPLLRWVHIDDDPAGRRVSARFFGSSIRQAQWLPDLGCVLEPSPALQAADRHASDVRPQATAPTASIAPSAPVAPIAPLAPIPTSSAGAQPTAADGWVEARRPTDPDLRRIVDAAFDGAAGQHGPNTRAVLVMHRGRVVAERYGAGFGPQTAQLGWSMAKTVTSLLVHQRLVEQGRQPEGTRAVDWSLATRRPAWLDAWRADARAELTLADLLFMRDELDHEEGYLPWQPVPRMLWGQPDIATWAAAAPRRETAGRWRYASAVTNIVQGLLRSQFGSDAEYWAYARGRLFRPIGADRATFEADSTGTLIGSSLLWATARDWAAIGELIRNDGVLSGRRILAPGWLAWATRPAARPTIAGPDTPERQSNAAYGAHVWLLGRSGQCRGHRTVPADTLALAGHWGQLVAVLPADEIVIVRLGWAAPTDAFDRCALIADLVAALRR